MILQMRIGLVAVCLWLVVERDQASFAQSQQLPNIVLLMGDDHGWSETGYYEHPHVKTPILDEMASTGLRMDRFYSAHPTCSPTRGSVITGRHPNRYGTFTPNCSIRPEEYSIARILRRAGYTCGHFGKWHLGPVKSDSPTNPGAFGFDQWLSHDNFFEIDPVLSRNGADPELIEGESSEVVVRAANAFIDGALSGGKPFFVVIWFGSPHEPYSGMPDDLKLYDQLPELYPNPMVKLTSMKTGLQTRRPLGEVLRERYAEITAMDRSIGWLREHLQNKQARDNTLLWYCGDNGVPGGAYASHQLRNHKGSVYEGGVRVPGIIEWPAKISQPRSTKVSGVTTDILPTICDVLDLPLPDRPIDGVSLTGLFDGSLDKRPTPVCFWQFKSRGGSQRRPYIEPKLQEGTTPLVKQMAGRFTRNFVNFHHPEVRQQDYAGPRAIIDGRFKLVIHEGQQNQPKVELFDLENDQREETNLAEQDPQTAAGLREQLRVWQSSVLRSLTGADY